MLKTCFNFVVPALLLVASPCLAEPYMSGNINGEFLAIKPRIITIENYLDTLSELCRMRTAAEEVILNSSRQLRHWAAINPNNPEAVEWERRFNRANRIYMDVHGDALRASTRVSKIRGGINLLAHKLADCERKVDFLGNFSNEINQNIDVWRMSR